jgi:hypothetical protein
MSAVDGSIFEVYQGAFRRRAAVSAGWCPAVAYQQTATAWQASMNGIVRSTARAVRLWAWPVPNSCFASSIATSMVMLAIRGVSSACCYVITSGVSCLLFDAVFY